MSFAVARNVGCAAALVFAGLCMAFAPTDPPPVAAAAADSTADDTLPLRQSLDGPDALSPDIADNAVTRGARTGLAHWAAYIEEASQRFSVPTAWIRAVMARESGGRTCDDTSAPITSKAGAMGLMQLMPGTYDDLRRQYGLGRDPYNPHDNILAGTAYLKWLKSRYGYPAMFAAYNHGPGNFEEHLRSGRALPRETQDYLVAVTSNLHGNEGVRARHHRHAPVLRLRLAAL